MSALVFLFLVLETLGNCAGTFESRDSRGGFGDDPSVWIKFLYTLNCSDSSSDFLGLFHKSHNILLALEIVVRTQAAQRLLFKPGRLRCQALTNIDLLLRKRNVRH